MTKVVIDADSFVHIAVAHERETGDIDSAVADFYKMIDSVVAEYVQFRGDPDIVRIIFSPHRTFRNELSDEYKINRRTEHPWIPLVKSAVLESARNAEMWKGLEADDICIAYQKYHDYDIIAYDKDVLLQATGFVYDWKRRLIIDDPYRDIDQNIWFQTIMGDSTDGIKGVQNIGKARAAKYIEENEDVTPDDVLNMFDDDDERMLETMRLISLHQLDQDFNLLMYESIYDNLT